MLRRIFPEQIDNNYQGHRIAIRILVLFLPAETFASINQIGLCTRVRRPVGTRAKLDVINRRHDGP